MMTSNSSFRGRVPCWTSEALMRSSPYSRSPRSKTSIKPSLTIASTSPAHQPRVAHARVRGVSPAVVAGEIAGEVAPAEDAWVDRKYELWINLLDRHHSHILACIGLALVENEHNLGDGIRDALDAAD